MVVNIRFFGIISSLRLGNVHACSCTDVCVERDRLSVFRERNSPENFADKKVSLCRRYASGDGDALMDRRNVD